MKSNELSVHNSLPIIKLKYFGSLEELIKYLLDNILTSLSNKLVSGFAFDKTSFELDSIICLHRLLILFRVSSLDTN